MTSIASSCIVPLVFTRMIGTYVSHAPHVVSHLRTVCPCFLRSRVLSHTVPRSVQHCAEVRSYVALRSRKPCMQSYNSVRNPSAAEGFHGSSRRHYVHNRQHAAQRSVIATATSQSAPANSSDDNNSPSTAYITVTVANRNSQAAESAL